MPKLYMPDLIEVYTQVTAMMRAEDIPLQHRMKLAGLSGMLKYYVADLTKDINVEVVQ
jgi:hypothetical protein